MLANLNGAAIPSMLFRLYIEEFASLVAYILVARIESTLTVDIIIYIY